MDAVVLILIGGITAIAGAFGVLAALLHERRPREEDGAPRPSRRAALAREAVTQDSLRRGWQPGPRRSGAAGPPRRAAR